MNMNEAHEAEIRWERQRQEELAHRKAMIAKSVARMADEATMKATVPSSNQAMEALDGLFNSAVVNAPVTARMQHEVVRDYILEQIRNGR